MYTAQDILDFDRLIGSNFNQLLSDYVDFSENSMPLMRSFFEGKSEKLDNIHNVRLTKLWTDALEYESILQNRRHLINDSLLYEIANSSEEVILSVAEYLKVDKFSRSTSRLPSVTHGVRVSHTMLPGTVEDAVLTEMSDNNFDEKWVEVAKYNDLFEIDYDYRGGKRIDLILDISTASRVIPVVVDYMFRDNLLGKDFARRLDFSNDDFVYLTPERTLIEAVEILSVLYEGDIPEFPELGRAPLVGTNAAFFAYGSTIRQLTNVFRSDPTIESIRINGYDLDEGDINLSFEITNVRDDIATQARINIVN